MKTDALVSNATCLMASTVAPLIVESRGKWVSTGVLQVIDDASVVRTKVWRNVCVSILTPGVCGVRGSDGICRLWGNKSTWGDSILPKFDDFWSYGTSHVIHEVECSSHSMMQKIWRNQCSLVLHIWWTEHSSSTANGRFNTPYDQWSFFKPEYCCGHPKKYLFLLSKNIYFGSKYPKKHLIYFWKKNHCLRFAVSPRYQCSNSILNSNKSTPVFHTHTLWWFPFPCASLAQV